MDWLQAPEKSKVLIKNGFATASESDGHKRGKTKAVMLFLSQ